MVLYIVVALFSLLMLSAWLTAPMYLLFGKAAWALTSVLMWASFLYLSVAGSLGIFRAIGSL